MEYKKEAFDCLEITEEEISSIRRYRASFHTNMNALLDLDPKFLLNLNSGWRINLSREQIKENIEHLEKIYTAMYKYGKKNFSKRSVYRGTTNDEVRRLEEHKQYDRILSTSTDKDIATTFTLSEYTNGALMTINIGENIPYLNMDDFLDDDQISESEILLAPYCKIGDITEYGANEDSSITNYSLSVVKTEFNSLSEVESKECENKIYEYDLNEDLQTYFKLSEELEGLYIKLSIVTPEREKEDPDLKPGLKKEYNEVSQKKHELEKRFEDVRNSMNKYLQGRFKQIELDIDKDIEKEKEIRKEVQRKKEISRCRRLKERLLKDINHIINAVDEMGENYLQQDEEEKKLNELADSMSITEENDSEIEKDANMFEILKSNLEEVKKEIDSIEISDDFTSEMLELSGKLNTMLNEKTNQLTKVALIMQDCKEEIALEKSQNVEMLKKRISNKIREAITDKTVSDLISQRNDLQQKKDSFFDKIFGKAKLKQAQIENLNLKIESVKKGGLNIPDNFEGVENYLKKYSQVVGYDMLPKEAQEFLKDSKKEDMLELIDKEREKFELYFNTGRLVDVNKKISRKDMLVNILLQNQKLNTQINDIQTEEVASDKFQESLHKCEVSKVEQDLDMAISLTEKNIPSEDKVRMQKKEIEDPNNDVISF